MTKSKFPSGLAEDLLLCEAALSKTPDEIVKANNNTPIEILLDEIRDLRAMQKKLSLMEGLLQNLLFARLPGGALTPETYDKYDGYTLKGVESEAVLTQTVQSRFNSQKFKSEHPDLYKKYTKVIAFMQMRFTKKDGEEGEE